MKLALGDYMNIANSFDGLCLTDSSYEKIVNKYPYVDDLAMKYVREYGKRVLNVSMKGAQPQILYTPFDIPEATCEQLSLLCTKNNWSNILIPMPKNYESIKDVMERLLYDRFIVVTDDAKYLGITENTVIEEDEEPQTDDIPEQYEVPEIVPMSTQLERIPTVCVTGHRPDGLYGWYSANKYSNLQNKIYACVEQLYKEFGVRRFISGCARGADQLFFYVVDYLKTVHTDIANDIFRPFSDHGMDSKPTGMFNLNEYTNMLQKATTTITVRPDISSKSTSQEVIGSLFEINQRMVDESDYVLGIYGGDVSLIANSVPTRGGTLHCLRYAYKNNKKIILINPHTLVASRFNF